MRSIGRGCGKMPTMPDSHNRWLATAGPAQDSYFAVCCEQAGRQVAHVSVSLTWLFRRTDPAPVLPRIVLWWGKMVQETSVDRLGYGVCMSIAL
jgi:hypothetical protein